jgi:DNA-binding protein HU-beta
LTASLRSHYLPGMNKSDLVGEVVKRTKLQRGEVSRTVDTVLEVVRDRVARGEKVSLAGFGTFEKVRRNPRVGRNPHTREAVKIPARNAPSFKPGTAFRQAVAGRRRRQARAPKRVARKR